MPPDALSPNLSSRINQLNFLYARKHVQTTQVNLATSQPAEDYFL
jgi:hypothetical protein